MIDLFLSIPEDVIRNRIIPFFDVASLVKLDSATLSSSHRPNLLNCVLYNAVLVEDDIPYSKNLTTWLIKRGLHLQCIHFPEDSEPLDLEHAGPVMTQAALIVMVNCKNLTNISVQTMIQKCKSLEGIVLEGCSWVDDETLKILADCHRGLQEFILGNCPLVTDAGAAYVVSKCNDLSDIQWDECPQIGVQAMAALAGRTVRCLFIANCPSIIDQCLVEFVQKNNNCLAQLIVSENNHLTDVSLLAIARHCPGLVDINISNCHDFTDSAICAVIESCQKLTSLRAEDCHITTAVFDSMSAHISPELTTAWLRPCSVLTDAHVEHITKRATQLIELCLSETNIITNAALESIARNAPNLSVFGLEMSPHVSLSGVQALVRGCVNLVDVSFLMCRGVCDLCLEEIAVHCKKLIQLSVTNSITITDAGVRAIAQHCQLLQHVNLSHTFATDVTVEHLIDCCPALVKVHYLGRVSVSQSLLRLVQHRHIELVLDEVDSEGEFEALMQLAMQEGISVSESDDSGGDSDGSSGNEDDNSGEVL